ncbi:MAG: DNA gyrase subunit A [Deltaproteobacteria bacterium]|nr:DNA gyrase subunit A [Deltaproteobacteria bacterium]
MDNTTSIIPVNIEDEMRGSFLDYAMSVIIGRALPDIRDGLKPVHRRILFAMFQEGLLSNRKYSKCAGVVGEVLKHYHPHGDGPVYGSLVRMAQPWNLRYPLIDGQGNFGSIDGDAAAAYRYTESRMFPIAEALLADIDKDTVDFIPNFDDSTTEPVVLPSRVPNLLVNGAEGIAVGMASSIPPHNLREVIAATIHLIKNPEASVDELMEHVPGPDFPTAGIIYGAHPLREMYSTGRALIQLRSKVHVETLRGKRDTEAIVIDEIPYQTNKAKLVEKIAELVNDKKIEGIARLRDESDRQGMRVVIELKKDAVSDVVTNQLFKLTPMQRTFGVIMLAIVDGKPEVLSLRQMLHHFIEHRRTVITRRTRFELAKALARLHILEGLLIALQNIDEVVAIIKAADSTAAARDALQARFSLSEIQAQQILDMPLKRLTGLERKSLEEEHKEVTDQIEGYRRILGDAKEVDAVVVSELTEISEKFGDERRTQIEENGESIDVEDMIADEDMIVTISYRGYAKRCSPSLYRSQKRGGKGVQGTKKLGDDDGDFISDIFVASTHAYLLVFTTEGKVHWLKVYQLPEQGRTSRGRAIVNMLNLGENERVSAILPVRRFEEGKYVIMATKRGFIKRVDLMEFSNVRRGGIRATNLDEADYLIGVRLTEGNSDCIISTRNGMAIRFAEDEVRVMGRTARGVTAVRLDDADEVMNLVIGPRGIEAKGAEDGGEEAVEAGDVMESALLTVCENGYGKRTSLSAYRRQGRAGKGLIDIKTEQRNGPVIGMCEVSETDQIMIITTAGKIIRSPVNTVSRIGRNTMGVRLINLDEGEKVAAVGRIAESAEEATGDESVEDTEE